MNTVEQNAFDRLCDALEIDKNTNAEDIAYVMFLAAERINRYKEESL